MRFVPIIFIAFKLILASENENNENELTANEESPAKNPLSSAQRRTAIIRRNSCGSPIENELPSHRFDEYEVKGLEGSDIYNQLPLTEKQPFTSARKQRKPRKTESSTEVSAAARLFPPMPVDKPIPTYAQADSSESDKESGSELEDLLKMIPDRFTITENGGTYGINQNDYSMTSADVMRKRSALYRLLSEVYTTFDMFDFDGFMEFLRKGKSALSHLDLRYHLIENLVQRSLKTTNEGTLECLVRFIQMIDSASVMKTAGKEEIDNLSNFEERISELKRKNPLSPAIASVLTSFFTNEKKRLDPLQESLSAGDYEAAKRLIESSNRLIFVSANDFERILGLSCSSARFYFVSWAISNGHFSPQERLDNDLMTPLMLAAKCPRWSNDIVKAILWKAPETQNMKNSEDRCALDLAKSNKSLRREFRKPLIEMLELEYPNEESLDQVLNKYK